jgi:FKBP-type peptidyl-prolyl cis-trans isomerase
MFNKFELIGGGISILCMALALYLMQVETNLALLSERGTQLAQVPQSGVVIVEEGTDATKGRIDAYTKAADDKGNIKNMVIDDIKVGSGEAVKSGDIVSVHYVGTLQNGQEFDNSKKRGEPFEFTVGEGRVIAGWEQGLVGMKVGGQRMLVIPPELGYGEQGVGPIPSNATLVFAIELLDIK